jgi:ribosomal protein S18 acetylase RimI-like enzyme
LLKQVLVLENNPAITWYEKNGFEIVEHKNNFVKMVLKK